MPADTGVVHAKSFSLLTVAFFDQYKASLADAAKNKPAALPAPLSAPAKKDPPYPLPSNTNSAHTSMTSIGGLPTMATTKALLRDPRVQRRIMTSAPPSNMLANREAEENDRNQQSGGSKMFVLDQQPVDFEEPCPTVQGKDLVIFLKLL